MPKQSIEILILVCALLTLACVIPGITPTPTVTPTPTFTPTLAATATSTPRPTATPEPPDTGWQRIGAGMEVRSLNVPLTANTERVTVVRLDSTVRFQVLYTPGQARPVSAWAQESGARVVINAGYFTEEYLATGLLVSNGERYGASYEDYAGMFAVTGANVASVRWLRAWPYDSTEALREAVQCFPVLVKPGGVMGFPADADDGRTARRTVIAQDRRGRILLLIAPRGYFSLHTLAVWLTESDLEIDTALNLDGGTSSGLWMQHSSPIDSLIGVPAVIAVME